MSEHVWQDMQDDTRYERKTMLLTDKHVERAVTLLALICTASNPVEVVRYQRRLIDLRREHPELNALLASDPRVKAKVLELSEAFAPTPPVIPVRSTEADETAEVFDTADDALGDYSDTEEGWRGYR